MAPPFDPVLLRRWIDAAAERLTAARTEIDRINVFPVADHDTGSNLLLTVRAAAAARLDGGPARAAAALATAAVRGARGNSGLILSQLFRGVAEELAGDDARPAGPGRAVSPVRTGPGQEVAHRARGAAELLAGALRRAAALATVAVSAPRQGTALTVLDAAAAAVATLTGGAAAAGPPPEPTGNAPTGGARVRVDGPTSGDRFSRAGAVRPDPALLVGAASVAAVAARDALARPSGRPAELVRAGVVDAGGLGLVVVLDALVAAAGGVPGPVPPGRLGDPVSGTGGTGGTGGTAHRTGGTAPDGSAPDGSRPDGSGPDGSRPVYEVTYRLPDPGPDAVAGLRARLAGLGDSVGIAGDGAGEVAVHVHTRDAGPAVEAGLDAGRPTGIRIELLPPQPPSRDRAVLLMIESDGAGALARAAGGDVLAASPGTGVQEVLDAVRATGAGHVVVLPCAAPRRTLAEATAALARGEGVEVVVVPATSVPAGLAALAVHDPARLVSDDVVAMAEAAAGTRTGGLRIAETEALTWAGPCRPGEVLGISDGEVVLIAPDLAVGALWLAHRMLTPGGELVTALLGAGTPDALGEHLAEDLRRTHPEVDVVLHRGGQEDYPLVLGVE